MGEDARYLTANNLLFYEILEIHDQSKRSFLDFSSFALKTSSSGYFSNLRELPPLSQLNSLEVSQVEVKGYLPNRLESLDVLEKVQILAGKAVGKKASLTLACGIEEKNSIQSDDAFDKSGWENRGDRILFFYIPGGAGALNDRNYRKLFISRLISELALPMIMIEEGSDFFLKHSAGGHLWVSMTTGIRRENPAIVFCEIVNRSAEELSNMLRKVISNFSSQKTFEFSWNAKIPAINNKDPELATWLYSFIRECRPPAESYSLNIEFRLADLSVVDALRNICGSEDRIFSRLCSFDLPNGHHVELTIVTSAEGHRIMATARFYEDIKIVEEKLNLQMRKT